MITITVPFDNLLNQKTYETIINTLQFHQLQCTCGHSGCLTIHGYYTRSLKKDDSEIPLSICRVRCSHCGRTHALLISSLRYTFMCAIILYFLLYLFLIPRYPCRIRVLSSLPMRLLEIMRKSWLELPPLMKISLHPSSNGM